MIDVGFVDYTKGSYSLIKYRLWLLNFAIAYKTELSYVYCVQGSMWLLNNSSNFLA